MEDGSDAAMMVTMLRLRSISRGPAAMLILGGAVLGLYVMLLVGSFLDSSFAGAHIGRNIRFAGTSMSGTPPDTVDDEISTAANGYGDTPVEIDAGHGAVTTTAADLGLTFDVGASARAVESANESPLLVRPVNWIASFFDSRDVEPRYTVDDAVLNDALVDLDLPGVTEWKLPSLDADATGVRIEPGRSGSGIDPDRFAQALLSAAESGDVPLQVTPELVEVEPPITDEAVEEVAAAAEAATGAPLEVTVGETTGTVDVATLRSWLELTIEEDVADWDLDHDRVMDDLQEQFAEAGSAGADVSFVVEDGRPVILPGADRTACCDEDSPELIVLALRSGAGDVQLPLRTAAPEHGREWAESLGIVEEVASFTTTHSCCQNRVENIHLIADAVRGVVLEPGETLSMNDHVGRRTAEKGYLPAGGITNGVLVDQLGGGVSQFTTTLFNAAFFAGLDFGEYQAHTIYFSRYPYGREATLSYPAPDLQIQNTSPYGVLIWPTYTDTSITVTLYSTRHVEVEQTGQTESASGACTLVRTERTRTYDDGRTEVDHVTARYRP
ncbi:MAG: VanW family protein, partial [Acidimicrobiales bacterium]